MKLFSFLFHDAHVGPRNTKLSLRVIIGNPLQQGLSGAEGNGNEAMKDERVSDRQRQNEQESATKNRERIAPSSFALNQKRNRGEKKCQQHRVCSEPT